MPAPDLPAQGSDRHDDAPHARPWARLLAVAIVLALVGGLIAVGVRATAPEDAGSAFDRWFPAELGTTWVYEARSAGERVGIKVTQVTGREILADQPGQPLATILETRGYEGDTTRAVSYYVRRGRSMSVAISRDGGIQNDAVPDFPILRLPFETGRSWSFSGEAYGLSIPNATTTVTGVEDVEVAGMRLTGCVVTRTEFAVEAGGTEYPVSGDSWTCPGVGNVRSTTVSEAFGLDLEDELIAFSAPNRSAATTEVVADDTGAAGDASEVPGGNVGLDPGRSNAVDEAPDLSSVAWQDLRNTVPAGPPVGTDEVMVLAEEDGTVSAMDHRTGEVLWRARLDGRALGSPVIAGPVAVVADAGKRVTAFDLETGRVWWTRTFPDIASAPALAAEGLVLVPFHDRTVRAIRVADGTMPWESGTAGFVLTPPARAGDLAIVSDREGEVLALRIATGEVEWEHELATGSVGGPAVRSGTVVLADEESQVTALSAADGRLLWEASLPSFVSTPVALGPQEAVVHTDGGEMFALDLRDGTIRWRTDAGSDAENAPLVAGGEVLVLGDDSRLRRFSLEDGSSLGQVALPTPGDPDLTDSEFDLASFGGLLVAQVDADEPWPNPLVAYRLGSGGGEAGVTVTGSRALVAGGSLPLDPNGPRGIPVLVGDRLVFPGYDQALWSASLDPGGPIEVLVPPGEGFIPWVIDGGDVLLTQVGRDLVAIPPEGGEPRWSFEMGEPFPMTSPAVADGRVFVPIDGGGLAALDVATGEVLWERRFPGIGHSTPVVVGGVVVHGVGGLAGFDAATGDVLWRIDGLESFSPLAAAGGTAFGFMVSDTEAILMAVDATTGAELWRTPFQGPVFVGPTATADAVVAASSGASLHVFDAGTGQERWSLPLRTAVAGAPQVVGDVVAVAEEGRRELVEERDYRVTFLDLDDGRFLGSYEPSGTAARLPAFGPVGGRLHLFDAGYVVLLEVVR